MRTITNCKYEPIGVHYRYQILEVRKSTDSAGTYYIAFKDTEQSVVRVALFLGRPEPCTLEPPNFEKTAPGLYTARIYPYKTQTSYEFEE